MAAGGTFSTATLNVRGLNSVRKISVVLESVKDLDIVGLQETHFTSAAHAADFHAIFSKYFEIYCSYASPEDPMAGIALLINRKLVGNVESIILDLPGRALAIKYVIGPAHLYVSCIYVPASPDTRANFLQLFHDNMSATVWFNAHALLFLGDYNLVEDPSLDRSGAAYDRQVGLDQLLEIKETFRVLDPFRYKNPIEKIYTFFSNPHGTQSRIDRIYCSQNMADFLTSYRTRTVNLSDHAVMIVRFSLKFLSIRYGPSYYKLNTLLLNDNIVQNYITQRLSEFNFAAQDLIHEWESLKFSLKRFFQLHQRNKAIERKRERLSLEGNIRICKETLQRDPTSAVCKTQLKLLQRELEYLNNFYVRQCLHNSHYRDILNDRISLSTAKSFQKRSCESRYFYALTDRNGHLLTDSKDILQEVREQYISVFTAEPCNHEMQQRFLRDETIPRLTEEERSDIDMNLSADEIRSAILSFERGKTPGSDGLPVDLYVMFIGIIVPILKAVYAECFSRGCLSPSMQYGIISQLYKKGDRTKRENWRPLTMLNVDYKILTKILCLRLKGVSNLLVSSDQTCAVPGREIKDGILNLYNIVEVAKMHNTDLLLCSLDHKAAFDMVEWTFIKLALTRMGLGPIFCKWIECIYNNGHVSASVMVNGFVSLPFQQTRGIRQGCPLSPILYVLTTEILACYVRNCNRLRGVSFFGKTYVISKYADDTTIFTNNYEEIETVFSIFMDFQAASGSRLSDSKTQILPLGSLRDQIPPVRVQNFITDEMKIYGVSITSDGMECDRNWEKSRIQIRKLERATPPRCVSLFGKVHTVMTYYFSALWYVCNIITPSSDLIKDAEKQLDRYLWYPSRKNLIKKSCVKLPKNMGGLNYPDIQSRLWAMRLMLLVKRWKDIEAQTWHHSFDILFGRVRNKTLRQLEQTDAPKLYKELRSIQIKTNFRRIDRQVFCFGQTFSITKVKSRDFYDCIIRNKFGDGGASTSAFWTEWTGCTVEFVAKSWRYARTRFEDSFTRTFHYKLLHRSLLTRDKACHFMDVPDFCSFCYLVEGNICRENILHVYLFCARAYNLYHDIDPVLVRISGLRNIELTHLIFGIEMPGDPSRQLCFNLLVHTAQRAIWMSKKSYDDGGTDFDLIDYIARILFSDICKCRTLVSWDSFMQIFGGPYGLIQSGRTPNTFTLRRPFLR